MDIYAKILQRQLSFIENAKSLHGDIYDYSKVKYSKSFINVSIICKNHGIFEQSPNSHLNGRGCSKCSGKFQKDNKLFKEDSIKIHGDKYNYDLSNYVNCKTKVIIICKIHGKFLKTPSKHVSCKQGCSKCARKNIGDLNRKSQETFIKDCLRVHGDLYSYNNVVYIQAHSKVYITCKKHGDFLQTPDKHLQGNGCKLCSNNISKLSNSWLSSLNNSNIISEYKIPHKSKRAVDGYDPTTNTIYQFHGRYYHGEPRLYNSTDINKKIGKTYGELYNDTLVKDQQLRDWGYNLVIMWEYDWLLFKSTEYEAAYRIST